MLGRDAFNDALSSVQALLGSRLEGYRHDAEEETVAALEHHVTLLRDVLSRVEGTDGTDDSFLKHAASIEIEGDEDDPASAVEHNDIGRHLWHSRRIQQTLRTMLQGSEESADAPGKEEKTE